MTFPTVGPLPSSRCQTPAAVATTTTTTITEQKDGEVFEEESTHPRAGDIAHTHAGSDRSTAALAGLVYRKGKKRYAIQFSKYGHYV